jgi:hypothetical protein
MMTLQCSQCEGNDIELMISTHPFDFVQFYYCNSCEEEITPVKISTTPAYEAE